jgi:hypothetical protein
LTAYGAPLLDFDAFRLLALSNALVVPKNQTQSQTLSQEIRLLCLFSME